MRGQDVTHQTIADLAETFMFTLHLRESLYRLMTGERKEAAGQKNESCPPFRVLLDARTQAFPGSDHAVAIIAFLPSAACRNAPGRGEILALGRIASLPYFRDGGSRAQASRCRSEAIAETANGHRAAIRAGKANISQESSPRTEQSFPAPRAPVLTPQSPLCDQRCRNIKI